MYGLKGFVDLSTILSVLTGLIIMLILKMVVLINLLYCN